MPSAWYKSIPTSIELQSMELFLNNELLVARISMLFTQTNFIYVEFHPKSFIAFLSSNIADKLSRNLLFN